MSNELKPCPFCGGIPEINKHHNLELWGLMHRCKVLPTISFDWSASEAVLAKRWNTRA